jgi:hypothetical protein
MPEASSTVEKSMKNARTGGRMTVCGQCRQSPITLTLLIPKNLNDQIAPTIKEQQSLQMSRSTHSMTQQQMAGK